MTGAEGHGVSHRHLPANRGLSGTSRSIVPHGPPRSNSASPRERWIAAYDALSRGEAGLASAATARAEAHTVRVALLYALLDCSDAIQLQHLEAALAFWAYSAASARWVFGDSIGDPTADEIWTLARKRNDGITRTEVSNLFLRATRRPARSTPRSKPSSTPDHHLAPSRRADAYRPSCRGPADLRRRRVESREQSRLPIRKPQPGPRFGLIGCRPSACVTAGPMIARQRGPLRIYYNRQGRRTGFSRSGKEELFWNCSVIGAFIKFAIFVILLPIYYFPRAVWRTNLAPVAKLAIIAGVWGGLALFGTLYQSDQDSAANAAGCIDITKVPSWYNAPESGAAFNRCDSLNGTYVPKVGCTLATSNDPAQGTGGCSSGETPRAIGNQPLPAIPSGAPASGVEIFVVTDSRLAKVLTRVSPHAVSITNAWCTQQGTVPHYSCEVEYYYDQATLWLINVDTICKPDTTASSTGHLCNYVPQLRTKRKESLP